MVALFKSYIAPLVVMSAVPLGVVGVVLMLYFTGTPLNVQSLLGVIFMVGIVVSNTVLLTDFAQNLRAPGRPDADRSHSQGGLDSSSPGGHDRLGRLLRLDPDGHGLAARQRSQRSAGPSGHLGGLLAGVGDHLVRACRRSTRCWCETRTKGITNITSRPRPRRQRVDRGE